MSDTRASMLATLADINSKPTTPARQKAAANIAAALAKMDQPKPTRPGRERTFHDRERLMKIADDGKRSDTDRQRAKAILDGGDMLSESDMRFLAKKTVT